MASSTALSSVKMVGADGQISLGKQYAGRQVLIEEQEPGVWLIRTAPAIPDNEQWLHTPQAAVDLDRALAWAQSNLPTDTDFEVILERLTHGPD